jgi:GDP-L-fucose synthase
MIDGKLATPLQLAGRRTWVAGHTGMVGQALVRRLAQEKCVLMVPEERIDLRSALSTDRWIEYARPEVVFLAAARVGGIMANDTRPAEFIYDNLAIQLNVVQSAKQWGVSKLVLLGSSCIYPRLATQPISEEALLTGALEPTNEFYAIAKIAGVKLGQAFRRQYGMDCISAMPTNLYGPADNFDLMSSHVMPALIRKIDAAMVLREPSISIWGTGTPRREFLHVDDCADALVFLAQHYSGDCHINVGSGKDIAIAQLAQLIAEIIGYTGTFSFDLTKPDGTPRKLLDVRKLASMGWASRISLEDGLRSTYAWYRDSAERTAFIASIRASESKVVG